MTKRSTNFTGKKPIRGGHVLDLMRWVGMTDAEIRAAAQPYAAGVPDTFIAPCATCGDPACYEHTDDPRAHPLPMNGQDFHHEGEE